MDRTLEINEIKNKISSNEKYSKLINLLSENREVGRSLEYVWGFKSHTIDSISFSKDYTNSGTFKDASTIVNDSLKEEENVLLPFKNLVDFVESAHLLFKSKKELDNFFDENFGDKKLLKHLRNILKLLDSKAFLFEKIVEERELLTKAQEDQSKRFGTEYIIESIDPYALWSKRNSAKIVGVSERSIINWCNEMDKDGKHLINSSRSGIQVVSLLSYLRRFKIDKFKYVVDNQDLTMFLR